MWTANAEIDLKKAFDDAIEIAYGNGKRDELENLANLFGDVALDNYQQALLKGLDVSSFAAIDVAWIDKRPIATLTETGAGSELGDMMLVVNEFDHSVLQKSRACLLEVKQSSSKDIPPVPVTTGKSTKNQFKILAAWPTLYGLKATGSNHSYLLENIITQPGAEPGGVLAQAWYVAVKPPSTATPTPMPWMAAPAEEGAPFKHTLGDLFGACARGASLTNNTGATIGVGREFEKGKTLQNPPGWDALINTIISVTHSYNFPEHYFKDRAGRRRYIHGRGVMPFMALGGLNISSDATQSAFIFLAGIIFSCITLAVFTFVKPRECAHTQNKTFPVLFFNVYHGNPQERRR